MFTQIFRPSVLKFQNQATITAGRVHWLASWIKDDSCFVVNYYYHDIVSEYPNSVSFYEVEELSLPYECANIYSTEEIYSPSEKEEKAERKDNNDPLGQIHSVASSEQCFHFVLFC